MRIEVYFTAPEAHALPLQDSTVVVVDVLRATTSMVEALANGARAVLPTTSTEEAVRLAASLGRDDTLLCGERKGSKIEGFDLGNSPREYRREVVGDKRLAWTTTNGTVALAASGEAGRVVVAAFTNLSAAAQAVASADHLVIQCAGRRNRFSLEDALCAGHLVRVLEAQRSQPPEMDDAARAARALALAVEPSEAFLASTEAGRALAEIGLEDDFSLCAQVDRHDVVPELVDQALTLPRGG